MKFGENPKKQWHSSNELEKRYNKLNRSLNRLMILDHVWNRLVGVRGKFWVLKAVKGSTLYVQVKVSVARSELTAKRQTLIRELNKHFDEPWIEKIEML